MLILGLMRAECNPNLKVNAHHKSALYMCHHRAAVKMPTFTGAPSISQQGNLTIMSFTVESESEPQVSWFKGASAVNSGGRFRMVTKKVKAGQYHISCEVAVSEHRSWTINRMDIDITISRPFKYILLQLKCIHAFVDESKGISKLVYFSTHLMDWQCGLGGGGHGRIHLLFNGHCLAFVDNWQATPSS